jgi:hypothetical protein
MKLSIPEEAAINRFDVVGSPIPFSNEPCSRLDDPVLGTTCRCAIDRTKAIDCKSLPDLWLQTTECLLLDVVSCRQFE